MLSETNWFQKEKYLSEVLDQSNQRHKMKGSLPGSPGTVRTGSCLIGTKFQICMIKRISID